METATITSERGRVIEYDAQVAAQGLHAAFGVIEACRLDLIERRAEARKISARYRRGPQTVATVGYHNQAARIEAALGHVEQLQYGSLRVEGSLYDVYMLSQQVASVYCGGQSQMNLADSISRMQEALRSAWSAAVKAAQV